MAKEKPVLTARARKEWKATKAWLVIGTAAGPLAIMGTAGQAAEAIAADYGWYYIAVAAAALAWLAVAIVVCVLGWRKLNRASCRRETIGWAVASLVLVSLVGGILWLTKPEEAYPLHGY